MNNNLQGSSIAKVPYKELDMENLVQDAIKDIPEDDGPHTSNITDSDAINFKTVMDPADYVKKHSAEGIREPEIHVATRKTGKPFKSLRTKKPMGYGPEDLSGAVASIAIGEEMMTPEDTKQREKIVKSMKKNFKDFRKRYGARAKEVMYATATKMAMKEENLDEISKQTLTSYIKKAEVDRDINAAKVKAHKQQADYHRSRKEYDAAKKNDKAAYSAMDKTIKRNKGIMTARFKNIFKEQLLEAPKSEADKGEYDYEGDMAKSQLRSIIHNAQKMHDMLKENTNLPEWVQSKITLAEDYVLTAANYMNSEMFEEVESLDEISKQTLKSYVDKAGKSVEKIHAAIKQGTKDNIPLKAHNKLATKFQKRKQHVMTATHKITHDDAHHVSVNGKKWKSFKNRTEAEKAAKAVYNKTGKRSDVVHTSSGTTHKSHYAPDRTTKTWFGPRQYDRFGERA